MAIRQKMGMLSCVGTLLCAMLVPGAAQAAIYMNVDGIEGDVTAKGHEGWIEVVSVGYGFNRNIGGSTSGGARETGTPSVSEVKVLKNIDISTPRLLTEAVIGQAIRTVTIHFVNTGGTEPHVFFELVLSDTLVSAIRHSFQPDGEMVESLNLNFTKIEWKLFPIDNKGAPGAPIPGGFDVEKGVPL